MNCVKTEANEWTFVSINQLRTTGGMDSFLRMRLSQRVFAYVERGETWICIGLQVCAATPCANCYENGVWRNVVLHDETSRLLEKRSCKGGGPCTGGCNEATVTKATTRLLVDNTKMRVAGLGIGINEIDTTLSYCQRDKADSLQIVVTPLSSRVRQ